MPDSTWEFVPAFADLGITAFTTTRATGSFAWHSSDESANAVMLRWDHLRDQLSEETDRLASAHQVHGKTILRHDGGWTGLLRAGDADGHIATEHATAMAVTLADCVPVFIGHPSGIAAVLHSGWKGTEAGITAAAIVTLRTMGFDSRDLTLHCGPSICGACYEVSPDVYSRLTGRSVSRPTTVDLRDLICQAAEREGVRHVSRSAACTRCDNDRFFSHRCGDSGRQLAIVVSRPR